MIDHSPFPPPPILYPEEGIANGVPAPHYPCYILASAGEEFSDQPLMKKFIVECLLNPECLALTDCAPASRRCC